MGIHLVADDNRVTTTAAAAEAADEEGDGISISIWAIAHRCAKHMCGRTFRGVHMYAHKQGFHKRDPTSVRL